MEITEIEIVPIRPNKGLVGFASFVYNDAFYVGSVAIYTCPKFATTIAKRCSDFSTHTDKYRSRSFVLTMKKLTEAPEYDHNRMIAQLKQHEDRFASGLTWRDYIVLLERIYNTERKDVVLLSNLVEN